MDVTDEKSIIAAHEAAVKRFGRIDYAVNNAGTPGVMKPSIESTVEEFQVGIKINMLGVWIGQREQIRQMLKQEPLSKGLIGL
jgi:NAD(P)-dependent dehydrogenase (short-subunit alcohol dehydrogenase family)